VCGPEFLRYGGETTCLELRTKNDAVIILDAGTGIRKLGKQMVKNGELSCDFLFTHAHWDHLMGFPFFHLLYHPDAQVRLQGCPYARQYVENLISRVMAPPNFPVRPSDLRANMVFEPVCPSDLTIDSVTVSSIPLSHPNRGAGYRITEDGRSFVFLTDNELDFAHPGGLSFEEYREFVRDADVLYHDAEYTAEEYAGGKQGWGHASYPRAVQLAAEAGVGRLGLFHHNQDRTDDEVDRIVEHSREILREMGSDTECFAVAVGSEIRV